MKKLSFFNKLGHRSQPGKALLNPNQPAHLGQSAIDPAPETPRFSTIGWPPDLHVLLNWADREEVLSPLLLLIDGCHLKPRPAHVGKVLGYISQEIPKALLRLRASEFEFVDDLLSLAEAYSADESIKATHPPLRIMKSVGSAFPKGQLTKIPLLALLSRDIDADSKHASEERIWLEQLRNWCLIEFLKHICIGREPPTRLDEVAQKLRLCIDGYPVKREWANLFHKLRSPARSHEELHGHLKSRAAALRKQPKGSPTALSDAHDKLLQALELVDDPEKEAPKQVESSYDFQFSTHFGRTAQPSAPPLFEPFAVAGAASREQLDEDDPLPGVRIVPFQGSGDSPPPPFIAVDLDGEDSPDQQERDKKVIEYLSIEDQQRLPFSWDKPSRQERDRLTTWLTESLSSQAESDQLILALIYVSAQTARSVRLTLQMRISTVAQIDWSMNPLNWELHRLPPRRVGSARATAGRLDHVQPLASRIAIALPESLQCRFREWSHTRPDAATLAGLIDPDGSMEAKVRHALKTLVPRVTPAMLGAWLPQVVFEATNDPVLTHLVSNNSRTALPGACGYASYGRKALLPAVLIRSQCQLTLDPSSGESTPLNCAGSELRVDEQWLRDQLGNSCQRVESTAENPSKWLEYHNALTTYVTLILLAATGGRVIKSPFEAISDFYLDDDDQGIVYIEDKVVSTMHAGRLVPLAKRAVRLVRLRYLPWLEQLSRILSHVSGSALPDIKHLGKQLDHSQLPFLFYLTRSGAGELGHLEVSERTLTSIGGWPRLFDPNIFRHRMSTWLKEHGPQGGSTHETVNGLLGHNENGTVTWGPYSTRCWADDAAAFRPLLNKALLSLQPRLPRRFGPSPLPAEVAGLRWPASHLTQPIYGRQGRQIRLEENIGRAKREVQRELELAFDDLKKRGVMSDPKELDRIAQSMLTNEKGMPAPRGPLRYQAFCDKVQSTWTGSGAKAILRRRYIPQLEEATPFTSSAPQAVALFKTICDWYSRSNLASSEVNCSEQSIRLAATIGLLIDARVVAPAVINAVLRGKDGRIVRMNGRYHFEHSKQLSTDSTLPVMRWAITTKTAEMLLRAYAEPTPSGAKGTTHALDEPYQELKKILGLRSSTRSKILVDTLAQVVQQANWQQLPGICAAYLGGNISSVALDHSTWHRLLKGTAMLEDTPSGAPTQSDEEDWTKAILPDSEDDLIRRRQGAETQDVFAPAVNDAAAISPLAGKKRQKKNTTSGTKKRSMQAKATAVTEAAIGKAKVNLLIAPSTAESEKASAQNAARALFLDVHRALEGSGIGQTSRRRQITLALRQAIIEHTMASPTCRIYVDWIRSLCWEEVKSDQLLALSSIARYFGALSVCFEQLGYQHDLRTCDEEEVTSFYVDVMNARRQTQVSSEEERYKTWALALSLLKRFHRFSALHYGVEEPDWSDIDGEESTLSISPRLVLENEYVHALRALVGNTQLAQEDRTTLGFILLLCMRFGLRAEEAAKLKQGDWLELRGGSYIVLVRNNRMRALKSLASRRQVPLLFKLTDYEKDVIKRHFEKLEANAERGENIPLFPLLAAEDNDSASKAAAYRISQQLKRSTSNPRVSLHSVRHTFANMVACMLWDVPDVIAQGLFVTKPGRNWTKHVRELILSDDGVTRRSPWAIARLMGHAHPRTSMRSYVHLLPDITDDLVDQLSPQRSELKDIQGGIVVNLDDYQKETSYLKEDSDNSSLSVIRTPTPANVLQALRMFKNGLPNDHIGSACDLGPAHVDKLVNLLAEVDSILARHGAFNAEGPGPSRLLSHIRFPTFERLIHQAQDITHQTWQPTEQLGREYLKAGTLFGPSRQVVLFSPAQFEFFALVVKSWRLTESDFRIVGVRGLDSEVVQWAANHGFTPSRAEDFVYESKRPKVSVQPDRVSRKRSPRVHDGSAQRKKLFQADSVSVGSPPNPVRHRCVVLGAALSSESAWNSYELLLIVLVELHLYQIGLETNPKGAEAAAADIPH